MAIELGTRRIAAAFLIQEEAVMLDPYRDSAGFPTVGVGHLLSDNKETHLSHWKSITREAALDLLAVDLEPRLLHVEDATPAWTHTADKLAAMTSLAFNIGRYGFAKSKLCELLRDTPDDMYKIWKEWASWNKATIKGRKQVLRGLAERRMRELILFYRYEFELPTRMTEWK